MISSRAYVQANKNEIVAQVEREKPWRCSLYGFYYFFRRWPLAIFTGLFFGAVTMANENLSFWWAFLGAVLAAMIDTHFVPQAADMRQSVEDIVHTLYFEKFTKKPNLFINWRELGLVVVILLSFILPILGLNYGKAVYIFDDFYVYFLIFYILSVTILFWWYYLVNRLVATHEFLLAACYRYCGNFQKIDTEYLAKYILITPNQNKGSFIFKYYMLYCLVLFFFLGSAVIITFILARTGYNSQSPYDLSDFSIFLLVWMFPFFSLLITPRISLLVKYGMIARAIEAKINLETST